MTPRPPEPLPGAVRFAALAAVALGALVSFSAARELPLVLASADLDTPELDLGPFRAFVVDEKTVRDAGKAAFRAQLSAIESMKGTRSVILLALSTSAALVFVAGLRLRWPGGIARRGVARLLGVSAAVSALLRTLDGAQALVIVRRGTAALDRVLASSASPELQLPPGLNVALYSALSVGLTVTVVGLFLALGAYFRSARITELFANLDRQTE